MKAPDWLLETSDTSCDVYLFERGDERRWRFTETSSCVADFYTILFLLFSIFFLTKTFYLLYWWKRIKTRFLRLYIVFSPGRPLTCSVLKISWFLTFDSQENVLVPEVPTEELEHETTSEMISSSSSYEELRQSVLQSFPETSASPQQQRRFSPTPSGLMGSLHTSESSAAAYESPHLHPIYSCSTFKNKFSQSAEQKQINGKTAHTK